jgi:AraC-like DNA-binding protein
MQYRDRRRMELAKRLLLTGNLRIKEIAHEVGFVNPYHFSRRFRELTGQSPRDYRRDPDLRRDRPPQDNR